MTKIHNDLKVLDLKAMTILAALCLVQKTWLSVHGFYVGFAGMFSAVRILWSGDLSEDLTSVSQQQVWLQLILFIAETMYNLSSTKLLLLLYWLLTKISWADWLMRVSREPCAVLYTGLSMCLVNWQQKFHWLHMTGC